MQRTHKFRLYPSKQIEPKLLDALELHRQTYNILLGELNNQNEIDKSQIQNIIPDMKICDSRFKQIHSKAMQYECYRLFSNLSALAKSKEKGRKVGRLRFKGKNWFKTFTYNQSGFELTITGKRCQTLWLSKIGDIPIRCHRNIKGKIKQVTIKHELSGKWFASICEELNVTIPKKAINKVVGIDTGLIDVLWDSDNHITHNPKYLNKYAEQLARCQRRMSHKKKASNNKNKFRIKLARRYEKLANTRIDFIHKITRYYADNYDAIGMEDIDYSKMAKGQFGKSFLDACCGSIRQHMAYKVESTGGLFVAVNHRGTTIRCSQCQTEVRKEIWEREHNCPKCGISIPRDYNSALEIKRLTIEKIGQELSESTPEKMIALHCKVQQSSMSQEAPCES